MTGYGLDITDPLPRCTLPVFCLIDSCGGMQGYRSEIVNCMMRSFLTEAMEFNQYDLETEIQIAMLTYSTGCKWLTPGLMMLDEINWKGLVPRGMVDFGEACRELDDKMRKKKFMQSKFSFRAPFVIWMTSNREPTDNYIKWLGELWENKWFQHSARLAIPIGEADGFEEYNFEIMDKFTGTRDCVLQPVETAEQAVSIVHLIKQNRR
jgi:uncharacterized protein YegL